ncbi:chondroitin sulfate synthase 1 isoform X1 [Nilaparvata lugens]|uniref:chondroitin sulfate synthase 1 isoform X1 n=1 Tax=Nilaparvata lugens TaxID=108931 RepID=UPI00193E19B4|nr:chondroitin sulfate synthase 1 isoform X1 [Nilaparvata lugens]
MAARRSKLSWACGLILGLAAGLVILGGRPGSGPTVSRCQGADEQAFDSMYPVEEDPFAVIGLDAEGGEGDPPSRGPTDPRRSLLFVGVMTAKKYLATRAVAVHETWGKELPGKIAFFSSEGSRRPPGHPRLPLVALRGVDDSYPPQKKSFLMLQYMWENYGDRFEWFVRADDDVYMRPDRLAALLRSVDSSRAYFVGQAGRGNQEEFGSLSLEYDENFCMGGPGVVLSRETLARVAPHVRACLGNLYTTHEDVELGRCVRRFARVSCTWSYEMQTILYHNSSGKDAFTGSLKMKEVHRAITLHPIKRHNHLYRIHNYMKGLKIHDAQQRILQLHRDLAAMTALLGRPINQVISERPFHSKLIGDSSMLGLKPSLHKFQPRVEQDVIEWDFIYRSLYSSSNLNPRRRMESALREGLDDVIREVMDMINQYSRQRGRVIDFKEILYGYHRMNPVFGADYILDLLLVYKKYRGRKMTVPVRRHAYLQQQFTGLEIREMKNGAEVVQPHDETVGEGTEDDNEGVQGQEEAGGLREGLLRLTEGLMMSATNEKQPEKLINFILPLAGRFSTFQRFVKNFEEVCLETRERVSLIVVLFPSEDDSSVEETFTLVKALQSRHAWARIEVIPVFDGFARANALHLGAQHVSSPVDDLLLFIDVDMVFDASVLRRVRLNTVRGKLAYFPIVFSEFDPGVVYANGTAISHFLIDEVTGYWRQYGFGIASVYKSDLIQVGGLNVSIRGWGKEDVDLFDRFVADARLHVMRAPDARLVHVWHTVECSSHLSEQQTRMCCATRADTYASARQLGSLILDSPSKDTWLSFARARNAITTS